MRRPLYLSDRQIKALERYHNLAGFFFMQPDEIAFQQNGSDLPAEDVADLHEHIGEYLKANRERITANV